MNRLWISVVWQWIIDTKSSRFLWGGKIKCTIVEVNLCSAVSRFEMMSLIMHGENPVHSWDCMLHVWAFILCVYGSSGKEHSFRFVIMRYALVQVIYSIPHPQNYFLLTWMTWINILAVRSIVSIAIKIHSMLFTLLFFK